MHGFGHSAGFGGGEGIGNFGGGGVPQETVINNYYDDAGRDNDPSNLQASDDSDDSNLDDSSYDDSSFDDSQSGNDDLV